MHGAWKFLFGVLAVLTVIQLIAGIERGQLLYEFADACVTWFLVWCFYTWVN